MNKVEFWYVVKNQPRVVIYYEMSCEQFEQFMESRKSVIKTIHITSISCNDKEYGNKLKNISRSLSRTK